jgi:hypothetical protein
VLELKLLALAFGGSHRISLQQSTELWNGTSWTTNPNSMGTARYQLAGNGNYDCCFSCLEDSYNINSNRRMDRRGSPVNSNHNNFIIYNDDKL